MHSITTFQVLLKGLPRGSFDKLVKQRNADKYCKHFKHWDHLVAMMYAQLTGASGLRPLETAFNCHSAHHYHLGTQRLRRSTLADANEKRSDAVFHDVASWLRRRWPARCAGIPESFCICSTRRVLRSRGVSLIVGRKIAEHRVLKALKSTCYLTRKAWRQNGRRSVLPTSTTSAWPTAFL